MIAEFLSLSEERKVRIAAWMYHRYIVRPYLKEQLRAAQELSELFGDELEIVFEPDIRTLH